MKNWISRLKRDENGATAIEYAIIAGLVSLAIAGTPLSGTIVDFWNALDTSVTNADGQTTP